MFCFEGANTHPGEMTLEDKFEVRITVNAFMQQNILLEIQLD